MEGAVPVEGQPEGQSWRKQQGVRGFVPLQLPLLDSRAANGWGSNRAKSKGKDGGGGTLHLQIMLDSNAEAILGSLATEMEVCSYLLLRYPIYN